MKTKTGLALKDRSEAVLRTISGMNKKPKSFALAINPVGEEDFTSVISDILYSKDFLRENDFSLTTTPNQTKKIVIYVKPQIIA